MSDFKAVPSVRGEEPLLVGLIGPPGGGKTVCSLRLATGMRKVRPGPVVLIDTECGRSKKYSPAPGAKADPSKLTFDFQRIDFAPPFRPARFREAIRAALALNPAAVIVDSFSDEHEGEGGFLEFHDEIVEAKRGEANYVGGNEWAAWAKPKAERKRLISSLLQSTVPLLATFRAREKTESKKEDGRTKIVNIGWMPVAPLEIVHTLDLTCVLPPRADGVPVWTSDKLGEQFVIKLPKFLAPLIQAGQLNEATGEALARWAKGEAASAVTKSDAKPKPADVGKANSHQKEQTKAALRKLADAMKDGSLKPDDVTAYSVKRFSAIPRYLPDDQFADLIAWVAAGGAEPPGEELF